jgi:hypothetical protein
VGERRREVTAQLVDTEREREKKGGRETGREKREKEVEGERVGRCERRRADQCTTNHLARSKSVISAGPDSQFHWQPVTSPEQISPGPGVTAGGCNKWFLKGASSMSSLKKGRSGGVQGGPLVQMLDREISSCCRCESQDFQEQGAVLLQL